MTEASHDVFVDRRTPQQKNSELATQILFWYDNPHPEMRDSKFDKNSSREGLVRTNAIAITTDGLLLVARSTCYIRDQFIKKLGRQKAEFQLLGRGGSCVVLQLDDGLDPSEAASAAYVAMFPDEPVADDGKSQGSKRAFNTGRIFEHYKADIARRANELDDFNG